MTNHRYYRSTLTQKLFFWRLNHDASVSSLELCGSAIILAALAHTFIAGLGSGQSWFLYAGVLDSLTLEPLTYQEKIWKAELWLCEAKVLPVVGRKYYMAAGEAVMPSSTACCYSGWATPAGQVWPVFLLLSWLHYQCVQVRGGGCSLGKEVRKGKRHTGIITPFRHPSIVTITHVSDSCYWVSKALFGWPLAQVTTGYHTDKWGNCLELALSFLCTIAFLPYVNPC